MFRRRFFPFRSATASATACSSSSFCWNNSSSLLNNNSYYYSSIRFSSTSDNNNNNGNNNDNKTSDDILSELIDPSIRNLTKFLENQNNNTNNNNNNSNELVILVDATALLYRMCFAYKSLMSGKGCLETDPTLHLQRNLPKFLRFLHSVVPMVEKSSGENINNDSNSSSNNNNKYLIPPEVAQEALQAKFLEPSGGPWKSAGDLARLIQWKQRQQEQQEDDVLKTNLSEENDGNNNNNNSNSSSKGKRKSGGISPDAPQQMFIVESTSSPGLVRRKVIFCFDYGTEYTRSEFLPEYKAQRPRCGRISSFVGYASSVCRQLHSIGLIQGVLPVELAKVNLKDAKYSAGGSLVKKCQKENVDNNNNNNHDGVLSPEEDEVFQNLLFGATAGNPNMTPTSGEADDLIYTAAKYYAIEKNTPTMIVTHDKDLLQILNIPNTFFFHIGQNRFVTPDETCKFYGLENPGYLADYLTLLGDASDNVKGLEGVGNMRAKAILQQFGSLENLIIAAENEKSSSSSKNKNKTKKNKKNEKSSTSSSESNSSFSQAIRAEGTKPRKAGKFEQNLFEKVRKNSQRLRTIRDKVIALQETPETIKNLRSFEDNNKNNNNNNTKTSSSYPKYSSYLNIQQTNPKVFSQAQKLCEKNQISSKFLSENEESESNNNNNNSKVSNFFSRSIFFNEVPTHIWNGASPFRRKFGRDGPVAGDGYVGQKVTSMRKLWERIRNYYIGTHGKCDSVNELEHRCGDFYPRKWKKQEDAANKLVVDSDDVGVSFSTTTVSTTKKKIIINKNKKDKKKKLVNKIKTRTGRSGGKQQQKKKSSSGKKSSKNSNKTTTKKKKTTLKKKK